MRLKTKWIGMLVTEERHDYYKSAATTLDMTIAELIKTALKEYLKNE
jgi:hypothetical protein